MKDAAKFTRDNPATKVHLWNALNPTGSFAAVPVVQAKMVMGDNAPKYLLKNEYIRTFTRGEVDYYQLTPDGIEWLKKGLRRHLELHPEQASDLVIPLDAKPSGTRPRLLLRR